MPIKSISRRQQELLEHWLPGAEVVRDHSWGLVERAVFEMEHDGEQYVVKAGGAADHHIGREIHAHLNWLGPWTTRRRAPSLAYHDRAANLLVTRWLPGALVLDTESVDDPDSFEQAGWLLALLHDQLVVADSEYEARANQKTINWLDQPHRIAADVESVLRRAVEEWPAEPVPVVPTHGDWQPRNWLTHRGEISVIDFGRAELRPAMTDFTRLAAQDFRRDRRLESAFLRGYGMDPREPDGWWRQRVREAVGTAVWAYQVGDEAFEAQGHQMIADALFEGAAGEGERCRQPRTTAALRTAPP